LKVQITENTELQKFKSQTKDRTNNSHELHKKITENTELQKIIQKFKSQTKDRTNNSHEFGTNRNEWFKTHQNDQ